MAGAATGGTTSAPGQNRGATPRASAGFAGDARAGQHVFQRGDAGGGVEDDVQRALGGGVDDDRAAGVCAARLRSLS